MRLFDTHCHFDAGDPAAVASALLRAMNAGVERILAVGGSREMNDGACAAADSAAKTPERSPVVTTAFGYDMDGVDLTRDDGDYDTSIPASPPPAAIGEIGLDYHYYGPETRARQMRLFAAQLEKAREHGLPVVVHTREAAADTLALLGEIPSRGIIHCFTGTPDEARRFLDLGFYISFSGIVTFKAADNVRASALYVPDDRILVETDAPFLAPAPMRGKVNEPAFVRHTCEFLARLRGASPESFADLTFVNAESVLGRVSPRLV